MGPFLLLLPALLATAHLVPAANAAEPEDSPAFLAEPIDDYVEHGRGLLFRGIGMARMGRFGGISGAGLRQRRGPSAQQSPLTNNRGLARVTSSLPYASGAKSAPLTGSTTRAARKVTSGAPASRPGMERLSPMQRLVPWLAGAHMWRHQVADKREEQQKKRREAETARPAPLQANIDPATGDDLRPRHLHRLADGIRDKMAGYKAPGSTARRLLRQ